MGKPWELDKIPRPKTEKKLPVVLSPGEVKSILQQVVNLKYKTILMLIYSSGLRLSEALSLKIQDIDSKRMEIRVKQGKGKKDRYTLLSEIMLNKLREYYKADKSSHAKGIHSDWLFAGKKGKSISNSTIQKIFIKAKKKLASAKKRQYTHCGIVLPPTF